MTRAYGRAPRGERVVDPVPAGKYHSTTMMGALRRDGMIAALVYEGGTDVAVMQTFAEGVIAPVPRISAEIARFSAREGLQSR